MKGMTKLAALCALLTFCTIQTCSAESLFDIQSGIDISNSDDATVKKPQEPPFNPPAGGLPQDQLPGRGCGYQLDLAQEDEGTHQKMTVRKSFDKVNLDFNVDVGIGKVLAAIHRGDWKSKPATKKPDVPQGTTRDPRIHYPDPEQPGRGCGY